MTNPGDWAIASLGNLAKVYSGGTPSRSTPVYWSGDIPWVTTAEIDQRRIRSSRETITELGLTASATRVAPPGTLLMAMYGQGKTRGKVAMLEIAAAMNQACAAIEAGPQVHAKYLLHYLDSRYLAIRAMSNAGSQDNLSGELVKRISVAVPTIREQRAIAKALDDADDFIASLERLISRKREIKQGVMQDLLTARTHLPGFSGPWTEQPVSELLEFKNGLNKASQYFGHGTPIVNFMDVMRAPVITADRVNGLVSLSRDEIARFSARRGDMFFTRTSESVEEIGTAAVLVDDIPDAVFSGFVLRGRPVAPVNTTFLAYQFQLPSVRRQVVATASYTTRALTSGGSLGRVRVLVPSKAEQAAVVAVVADADAELEALARRLASARGIKTGMMQGLLTGRTRLPLEAAS